MCLYAWPARAHLMLRQQGTINVRGNAAYGAFSIPVSALHGCDDNADERLSNAEFVAHQASIIAQLLSGLTNTAGRDAGRRDLLSPRIENDENDPRSARGATHLLVLVKQSFATEPISLRFATKLFGIASDERKFVIRTNRAGVTEVGIVDPARVERVFFASAWQTVVRTLSLDTPVRVWPLTGGLLLASAGAVLGVFVRRRGPAPMIPGAGRNL